MIGDYKKFQNFLARTTTSFFGAGYSPIAPGTVGSLAAIPLIYWVAPFANSLKIFLWLGIFIAGWMGCKRIDQITKIRDNQSIVIDEVIGMGIATWTVGRDWKGLAAAFVLFRFFDILKLWPVRQVDGWSKTGSTPTQRGFMVILDDVGAGLQALALVLLLQHLGVLS